LLLAFGFQRIDLFRPEPVKIAIAIAQTEAFANPYAAPTGYTAHAAPIYPLFLAPIYYFFGTGRAADLIRVALSIAAASLSYALLPVVARWLGMPVRAGILAGWVGALFPAHYWPESMGQFETAWVAVFIELSVILAMRFSVGSPNWTIGAGLWCGIGLLLAPSLLPLLALLTALSLQGTTHAVRRYALVAVITALAISPWLIRNYVRLGGLPFVRDNFGLEFYLSNNDSALPELEQNDVSAFYQREHPFTSVPVAREMAQTGELRFERERMNRAITWIAHAPVRFCKLTVARIVNFWFSATLSPLPRLLLWGLNLSAAVGLAMTFRENKRVARLLGLVLLSYPAAYYLVHNGMRYQHAIYWILLLLSGVVGDRLLRRGIKPSTPS
jgi:hypothetical protein